jgi:hypothetical protein
MQPAALPVCAFVPHADYLIIDSNFCQAVNCRGQKSEVRSQRQRRSMTVAIHISCPSPAGRRSSGAATRFPGERARPRVQGSAPPLNPRVELSDEGVAADTRGRVCSPNPCGTMRAPEIPAEPGGKTMGNRAGGHFPLVERRVKRMICAVTRKHTKAENGANEKAPARKSKPSRIWVRPGLSKKRF